MKKSSLLWILLMAAGFGIVEMHSVMANKTGPTPSGATAKANPFRMTVDQANALVAESNQESKEWTRLMKQWDAETNFLPLISKTYKRSRCANPQFSIRPSCGTNTRTS